MERVGTLIDKLKEQFVQEAGTDKMLLTVQMLFSELQQGITVTENRDSLVISMPVSNNRVSEKQGSTARNSKNYMKKAELTGWLFEKDIAISDLHAVQSNTLNEQLKTEQQRLSNRNLDSTPIDDLKKAIGINDRYLFINELFRGDETMYERSLKTINNFAIFPEAHYWIQRELKVKLGWNEQSEIVCHFNQLVKRRFASI